MVLHDTPRRLSKRFSTAVSPGESDELTETVQSDSTVETLRVRLYSGAELDLELDPFKEAGGNRTSLVDYVGRQVIVGDDDVWVFQVSEPVNEGDTLGVAYEHTDASATSDLDFHVDMEVDRQGGLGRVLGGVF